MSYYTIVIIYDWLLIKSLIPRVERGDRGGGRASLSIFPIIFRLILSLGLFYLNFSILKCLSIYYIKMNSMIIQLIVHSCVFLIFTHFSVYMLYNAPLKLYNAPLYSKMAAFKSSNFSLAYTGRRAGTRFPPDTFGIYMRAPWIRLTYTCYTVTNT